MGSLCWNNNKRSEHTTTLPRELEEIDDELDDFGISLVTTEDIKYAASVLKVKHFPSLGMFRNGHFKLYDGSLKVNVRQLLSWMVDKETLEIEGQIEQVNEKMLRRYISSRLHVYVSVV